MQKASNYKNPIDKTRGQIKSLMVNERPKCINPRPMTKKKKESNSKVKIEVFQGLNCIKSKIQGQLGVQLTYIERWMTKLNCGKKRNQTTHRLVTIHYLFHY